MIRSVYSRNSPEWVWYVAQLTGSFHFLCVEALRWMYNKSQETASKLTSCRRYEKRNWESDSALRHSSTSDDAPKSTITTVTNNSIIGLCCDEKLMDNNGTTGAGGPAMLMRQSKYERVRRQAIGLCDPARLMQSCYCHREWSQLPSTDDHPTSPHTETDRSLR